LLLKFEGEAALAELVVWDTGATSLIIADRRSDRNLLDRHDLVLTADFKTELQVFFELLRGKASHAPENEGGDKLTWGETCVVRHDAPAQFRPNAFCSVVGFTRIRNEAAANRYGDPIGTVICLVEFQDGSSLELPEQELMKPTSQAEGHETLWLGSRQRDQGRRSTE
jgi:hypothetical protein